MATSRSTETPKSTDLGPILGPKIGPFGGLGEGWHPDENTALPQMAQGAIARAYAFGVSTSGAAHGHIWTLGNEVSRRGPK